MGLLLGLMKSSKNICKKQQLQLKSVWGYVIVMGKSNLNTKFVCCSSKYRIMQYVAKSIMYIQI